MTRTGALRGASTRMPTEPAEATAPAEVTALAELTEPAEAPAANEDAPALFMGSLPIALRQKPARKGPSRVTSASVGKSTAPRARIGVPEMASTKRPMKLHCGM